jgi:hypothetical protein
VSSATAAGPAAAAAATSTGSAAAEASSSAVSPAASGGTIGSSSTPVDTSSTSNQQVQWGYLLQLQQSSPRWAAAVQAYEGGRWDLLHQPFHSNTMWQHISNTPGGWERLTQQYRAAVELCRTLAAEAPLPVICNNLGCENLAGVSEAAAACKKCAGCSCCYCSRACQEADWKWHKAACRRMAAAGLACV